MISICIATYGDERWEELAQERALPSTADQAPHELVRWHNPDGTIAAARNDAAREASGDHLLFLDADDELEAGYVLAMDEAIAAERDWEEHWSLLFTPAVSYVVDGRRTRPKFWRQVPLHQRNWLVIGTVIEWDFFFSLGGFKDYGDPPGSNGFEDWSLWSRAERAGATIVKVPDAIYIAHQEPHSRHRDKPGLAKQWHLEIGRDVWPEHYPAGSV